MATNETAVHTSEKSRQPAALLYFLDIGSGQVRSVNTDGSNVKTLVEGQKHPDGLAVDAHAGYIYWTNMGLSAKTDDGTIVRSNLDGGDIKVLVPVGATFTPKQIQLDKKTGKLYWCDREGMCVMRCNLDGSHVETLVQTGESEADRLDATNWCVGIAVDPDGGKFYWTQKGGDNAGQGRIFRANIDMRTGESPAGRTDVELLFADLPEPIDLDLDVANGMLYWTDRGDPPRGNTVNRAPMNPPADHKTIEPEIVFRHLEEGIGLALDLKGGRMFVTDLAGTIHTANLDGSNRKTVQAVQGNLTGITYVEFTGE